MVQPTSRPIARLAMPFAAKSTICARWRSRYSVLVERAKPLSLARSASVNLIAVASMIPDALPLLVREPNHRIYNGSTPVSNFEIGSSDMGKAKHRPAARVPKRVECCCLHLNGKNACRSCGVDRLLGFAKRST